MRAHPTASSSSGSGSDYLIITAYCFVMLDAVFKLIKNIKWHIALLYELNAQIGVKIPPMVLKF